MLPIDLVQKRIANTSVGPSTVRGQPKGTLDIVIEYLQFLELQHFSKITSENEFKKLLDNHTRALKEKLPSGSWGISRKVINIFLFQAAHDILLNRRYPLNKIIPYLELPLDNPNAKKLKKFAKLENIPLEWKGICWLKPDENMELQKYAKKYADREHKCERCYLDIYWWRSE